MQAGTLNARAFRLVTVVRLRDSSTVLFRTSGIPGIWHEAPSPYIADDLHLGVVYDATLEIPGFFTPSFRTASLALASEVRLNDP